MNQQCLFYFATFILLAFETRAETRVAVALLQANNISGSITFTEVEDGEGLRVTGTITGLPVGKYGYHIHELGDISDCLNTGAHFDLEGNTHGGPDHAVRHIGDLGNVEFTETELGIVADIDFIDTVIGLRGDINILGRAVVLHEQEDDLGLGGHADSLTTGNAGARVACAVIGIKSPADTWNAANNNGPFTVITLLTVSFFLLVKV